ncbi:aldo/keto reductase [Phenylobacterium deserti]|uniref:Aldo/keto reductase n=1 Tax=Phenylobacterium deserti TaxID=1914756 RepID=A0A328AE24_9CAUL|nr:aldo/keto reductase [Phenylobacterium deserti]RAK52881.1 aldo/keto reductase [Phenylobacterium deserti]
MRYRLFGRTGLTVSEIGYGCASWWGKPRFSEAAALGLVHQAIDLGITFFDTGASYSAGEAEPRLGRALTGQDVSRLVVASKAGTFHAGGGRIARDFSPEWIVGSTERSLRNLGLEALGLLQLHGPSIPELTDELLGALEQLKARGLVRAVGVNSFDPDVVRHVIGLPTIDAVMIDYNVLRPEREPLIAAAASAGKGVLAGMALAMGHTGLKVAKIRGPQDLWYAARGLMRHRGEVARGARFSFLHRQPGITGSQAALAYVLENRDVACAVIGTTRPAHLAENAQASDLSLPPRLREQILEAQAAF